MAEKTKTEAGSSSSSCSRGGFNRGESSVSDFARRRSSCGYCKSGHSFSHGFWAPSLSVDDYQDLLDRGWRRSGRYLYKPDMERTCCPSYTIRLKASDYVPSKEQLRVCRRMKRFEDGELDGRKQNESNGLGEGSPGCSHNNTPASAMEESLAHDKKNSEDQFMHFLSEKMDNIVCACGEGGGFPHNIQYPKASFKRAAEAKRKLFVHGSENLICSSSIAFQIAAALKRAQSTGKNSSPEIIAEKLASSLSQLEERSDFSIRACKGHINIYSPQKEPTVRKGILLYVRQKSCLEKSLDFPKDRRRNLEIRLKRSSFDPEEYALYRKYQIEVHNDPVDRVSEGSYMSFLVDTPLVHVPSSGDGTVPLCGFGSFHQQYWIGGQLIAVGVFDILPRCLSSKYFFWDPDFSFLSLGKYSVIQEISWVKENQAFYPGLEYYYLGYYIHSCRKMRYKAAYRPSELLCPLRYQWVPYDIAKPLLDVKPYVVLTDFLTPTNGESSAPLQICLDEPHTEHESHELNDMFVDGEKEADSETSCDESDPESDSETDKGDVDDILIGLQKSRLRFKDLRGRLGPHLGRYFESQLCSFVRVVGADLSKRMVYFPS